jgi:hypothetical protein
MTWTIDDALQAYHDIRDNGRLKQGTYRDYKPSNKVYACALGAFFSANYQEEAHDRGCATGIMPQWLVDFTPNAFDMQSYDDAVIWADRLYGRGGLVERANRLPQAERDAMWEEALTAVRYEARTNTCLHAELGPTARVYVLQAAENEIGAVVCNTPLVQQSSQDGKHRWAQTVLDKVEDALEARWV